MNSLIFLFSLTLVTLCRSQCLDIFDARVGCGDIRFIVNEHNRYRRLIANGEVEGQPRGINLKKLKWDNDLAKAAQDVSNTCVYAHCIVDDSRWLHIGQNLYYQASTSLSKNNSDWAGALEGWFVEYLKYTYNNISTSGAGHYTQMIWADTEYVGCGYTRYEGIGIYPYKKLYTCNYGPAGNYKGEYPYETGTSGCENLC